MSPSRARVGVSADAFVAVVRAYADRVHDDVRRLGCTPAEAAEVVETSALNLAERLRVRPHEVPDLVGTWFRDARLFAERVASGGADPDVVESGEGIVSTSEEDAAARRSLAELTERDRVALLLRDAYDLPYASTAVALGVDQQVAGCQVARARLRFLRLATGEAPDEPSGHDAELSATAKLADGGLPPEEVAPAERHAAKCAVCAPLLAPLREARRLLSGLAILAMADLDRDALLVRASAVAERVLPSAAEVAAAAGDGGPSRLVPLSVAAACVAGAVALGAVVAFATGGGDGATPGAVPTLNVERPTPTPSVSSATPTPTPTATATPTPTATPTATPTPTPTLTASPTPTATTTFQTGNERISLSPRSGPNGTEVTVTGSGWRPGSTVTLTYSSVVGDTGQRGSALVRDDGTFTGEIVAYDPANLPGGHTVEARNGNQSARATFTPS